MQLWADATVAGGWTYWKTGALSGKGKISWVKTTGTKVYLLYCLHPLLTLSSHYPDTAYPGFWLVIIWENLQEWKGPSNAAHLSYPSRMGDFPHPQPAFLLGQMGWLVVWLRASLWMDVAPGCHALFMLWFYTIHLYIQDARILTHAPVDHLHARHTSVAPPILPPHDWGQICLFVLAGLLTGGDQNKWDNHSLN